MSILNMKMVITNPSSTHTPSLSSYSCSRSGSALPPICVLHLNNPSSSIIRSNSHCFTSNNHRRRLLPPSTKALVEETSPTTADSDSASLPRRLILLRHAESSWDNPSLRDHDRPLSKSGEADAATVSQKLLQLGWVPQLILSSDAARTRETLRIMQEHAPDFFHAEVRFVPSFYSIAALDGQTADHLQQAICNYSRDDIITVMCMGHNRGWEEAASMFTGASIELETCNAALLEATGKSWEEAFAQAGLGGWKFLGIVKPKE